MKYFIGDSKFYLLSKIFQGVLFIFNLKILTHFLEPKVFGLYSSINVPIIIFILFSTAWIGASIIRLSPNEKGNLIFFNSLHLLLIITLVITTFFLIGFFYFFNSTILISNFVDFLYLLLFYYSSCIFNYLLYYLRAEREAKSYSIILLLHSICSLVLPVLALALCKNSIMSIFVSLSIANIFGIFMILKSVFIRINLKYCNKKYIIEILKYGLPAIFIQLFVSLTMFSDQLILKFHNFDIQLGIYAANYTLVDKSINIVSSVFITTFQPIMFDIWEKESPTKAYTFLKKILGIYILFATIICFSLYYFYDLLVIYILTPNYNMGNLFVYIMIGSLLLSLSNFYSEVLNAHKKTVTIAVIYGITFFVGLFSNLYFVPEMGMEATALGNVLAYSILFIGMFTASRYYMSKL